MLMSLRERTGALENHIERALAAGSDAAVFTSLPRSGTVRAAALLAEIGDARGRFPTDDALAAAHRSHSHRTRRPAHDPGTGTRRITGAGERCRTDRVRRRRTT